MSVIARPFLASSPSLFGSLAAALLASACSTTPATMTDNDANVSTADAGSDAGSTPMTCDPVAPTCVDQQIAMLDLFSTVSTRAITEEGTGAVHVSHVDAMAGGVSPTESYVYARFTDTGLVRVDVSDEASFDSQEWDIAFRRFVIRLNSGVGGPSCVEGARLPNDPATGMPPTFESVTSVPTGLAFHSEAYMTPSCDYVPDGSGLMSPSMVLSSFWTYTSCVSMSHNVYVVALANGRHVKLEVLSYYNPADQEACDTNGTMPTTPGSSGNLRVQWSYLD
ncbi:MAG: HmuY family protein [Sandaracinus sp.]